MENKKTVDKKTINNLTARLKNLIDIENLIENGTMNASEHIFNQKVITSESARLIAKAAYDHGVKETKKKALEIVENIDNPSDRAIIKDMINDLL